MKFLRRHPVPPPTTARVPRQERELLTEQQKQIALQVGLGLDDAQIAAVLGISEKTVRGRVQVIMGKLGIHKRTALAVWVWQTGMLRLSDEVVA